MVCILGTVFLIIFGVALLNGKGVKHCNWFLAIPKKDHQRIDQKAFGRCIGKLCFFLAFCTFLGIVSDVLNIDWLFVVSLVLFFIAMIFTHLYVGSGERFRKY